ncbi:MAG: AAA family ATPase [Candidatus Hydrothermarchaeota archaeon]
MKKGTVIAVSGKGGTGKTFVSASLIHLLSKNSKSILAVDADADSNLPEALGIEFEKTVGDIREKISDDFRSLPPGTSKDVLLEGKIMEIVVEGPKFDLLVMGRPEGPGCYCLVNHMLRDIIDKFARHYDITVIDTEAGLEHMSRRTTRDVDILLVVTDPTVKGLKTAERIKELAKELEIKFDYMAVILNRVLPGMEESLRKKANELGLEVIGVIPEDKNVSLYDLEGKPVVELPEDSPSMLAIKDILNKLEEVY